MKFVVVSGLVEQFIVAVTVETLALDHGVGQVVGQVRLD